MNPRERLLIRARDTARDVYWSAYDRAEERCAACGREDVPLDVHHRDGDPLNNHLVNLIAVCPQCHRREHKRRSRHPDLEAWKTSFVDEMGGFDGRNIHHSGLREVAAADGGGLE